jgi:hypothetical protein
MRHAADWANANHDQSALIVERVARVSPEIVAASTRSYYSDTLDVAAVQPLIDMTAKYGNFQTFPAGDMIYRA